MEQSEKSLSEQIEELKKALEAHKNEPPKGSALQIENHMKLADKYLSAAATKALSKKGRSLIEVYNEQVGQETHEDGVEQSTYVREAAVCQYFTCQVRVDKVEEGVKAISETINELAEMGAIHSCLAQVSSVNLASMPFQHPTCAVICYVHIKPKFAQVAKNMRFNTPEGGIGEALHSLEIELLPGEFFAECRITHGLAMLHPAKNSEARVFDVVRDYLKYLPEGTEFVGYRQTAIVDTSLPYELKFKNPLLQRVKRVELTYVREAAMNVDGKKESITQFNLVTGIKYLGVKYNSQDGKIEDLYAYRDGSL